VTSAHPSRKAISVHAALLAELTLEEKASLCLGSDLWHTAPIPRLGIPALRLSDGPHGLRLPPGGGEAIAGGRPATCFPTASALGSSWDAELVRRIGAAIGAEARAHDVSVVLGPGINIKRSPLCGRNFEYFSEDPHVAGVLGAALIQGLQSRGVGACVKHFAANNQENRPQRLGPNPATPVRGIATLGAPRDTTRVVGAAVRPTPYWSARV
jgi:beta-glucosidase